MKQSHDYSRGTVLGICVFLAVAVLAVFSQTLRHEFVNFDDDVYVYENPAVTGGLTLKGIAWAFTHVHSSNWHPVTWMSHMLDCELYGLEPGGHHLTSVLLHAATAILLFLALLQLTSATCRDPREILWCSAFVAALFAIHPLRVESVAWVAERKDVLSGFFFMLTLMAYTRYTRFAGSGFPYARYLAVLVFFALGLMSKPMLVTLPFVLLLLDYWPLRRLSGGEFQNSNFKSVIVEKLPLFAMSAASCAVTVLAQKDATVEIGKLPMLWRFGNALLACVTYLRQTVWPTGLAVPYPLQGDGLPILGVILPFALLIAVCAVVFALRRKYPYAVTGWLWFLGMLVPVIGLMQVGGQTHADRYTYLPQIGLFIFLTWSAADLTAGWRHRRLVCGGAAALILAALTSCTWIQTSYWRDSLTLWTRSLASTSRNAVAHGNLGSVLTRQGKITEAIEHYRRALKINPDYADANYNLGISLASQGKTAEAVEHFRRALERIPDIADVHYSLGKSLASEAKFAEAIGHYRQALRIDPSYAEAHLNLGVALNAEGKLAEAIIQYTKALETAPDDLSALNSIAWILATGPETALRNGSRAIELALRADTLAGGGNPVILDTLAAAYAESARFLEATETARRALDLAVKEDNTVLADGIRMRLHLYELGFPYHEEPQNR